MVLLRAAEHPWVVLVEDDEPLERAIVAALVRALPSVEVRCTPDADQALALVHDSRSRLLITETDSAAVDGLALAACARLHRSTLPLIFLSEDRASARTRTAAFESSHLLAKPPAMDTLVKLVARILDVPSGFRGELRSHDLIELVQLVAMTQPTGALHLWTGDGQGTMWLDQGMVVHAATQGEQGMRAFRRMLEWTSGDFSLERDVTAPARTITLTTTQLLLEGARLLDEEAHERPEQSGTMVVPRSAAEHFERGLEAVHDRRYAEALPEWERAAHLEPENRVYQHNLRRLRHLLSFARGKRSSGSRA